MRIVDAHRRGRFRTHLIVFGLLVASACNRTQQTSGTFRLDARDFSFRPAAVSAEPGQEINLEIRNTSESLHNFSFPAGDIDKDIEPGATIKVKVTASKTRVHQGFFCKYHREDEDMVGNINVPSIDKPGGGRP